MKKLLYTLLLIFFSSLSFGQWCDVIYVTPSGASSGVAGTPTNPANITYGLTLVTATANQLWLASGTYNISNTLIIPSGVTIEGGFNAATWEKSNGTPSIINRDVNNVLGPPFNALVGLVGNAASNFRLQDLTITVANAPGNQISVYGIYLSGCSNYNITRCTVNTGAGSAGLTGTMGVIGSSGGNGSPGLPAADESSVPAGGAGGIGFSGNNGGNGGSGAKHSPNGTEIGLPGLPGCGGAGGIGGDGPSCGCGIFGTSFNSSCSGSPSASGQPGGIGTVGVAGSIGSAGSIIGGYWVSGGLGANGTNGTSGCGGGGGGGGAGRQQNGPDDVGGSGGGGGAGGDGGTGGTGGSGGGSSFAIFLFTNGIGGIIQDCLLNPGAAGLGGAGGFGGTGGTGGSGGVGGSGFGCAISIGSDGGVGGAGGLGGAGGTGANGVSVALSENGGTPVSNLGISSVPGNPPIITVLNRGCTNSEVIFTATSSGNWNFGSGATPATASGTGPFSVFYSTLGRKTITFSGTTFTDFINIFQITPILPTISPANSNLTAGCPTSFTTSLLGNYYQWYFPSSASVDSVVGTTTQTTPNIYFSTPGTYTVYLYVTTACCGRIKDSTTITIVPSLLNVSMSPSPASVCAGNSLIVTASPSGYMSYQFFINGSSVQIGAGNTFTSSSFLDNDTLNVIVSDGTCFNASSTVVVTVNPIPTVVVPLDTILCDAATTTTTNFTSSPIGATFTWTNDNTAIGLAANGTGNIASFTATNTTTAPILATITVTPTANSCVGTSSTYMITVNPTPTIVVPVNDTVCDGASVSATNYTSTTLGATFAWTNDNTAIGLAANGTGDIASFTATNTTTAPIVATITVTPTANSCIGTPSTYSIIVNPTPTVVVPANDTVCDAALTTTTNFTSPTVGATYSWTNDNTSIGLAANGTGDIVSFTATNTTTAPIVANITVTPSANTCVGTSSTYSITVNPTITVVVPANEIVCDAATTTATNFTSPTAGATFDWINDDTTIGLSASGIGDIASFTATNTTTAPIIANITVTPTANACVGTPSTYTITVNPTPTVVVPIDTIVCDAATVSATNYTSPTTGATYTWTNDNATIGLAASGTGNIASFTATNSTIAPIVANITVTPTANGCIGTSLTYSITVNPLPTPNFTFPNVCFGTITPFTDLSNANGGSLTNWNWDFTNNGSVDNTIQTPTNGYPTAGSYTVELMVETALGCKDSITKIVTINPIPVANFSATSECLNTITQFTDSSTVITGNISSYQWDFADGVGASIVQSPSYLYTAANTYNVSLTVISDSGCINTIVKPVVVFNSPTAAFTTSDVCQNLAANFNSTTSNGNGGTIDQWDWDIDFNGINHTTDYASQNPTNNYATANTYTVELIVTTTDGCSDTITNPITIFPMPNATYSFTDTCFGIANSFTDNSTVSSGTITNWDWSFGNTNTSTTQNPTQLYANDGQYPVTLIVTTNNFCKDTITQTVNVWPLPIVDFTPTEVCLNTPINFINLSTVSLGTNVSFTWNFGDATALNFSQNPMHTYTTDGAFQTELFVTTNHACKDSLTKTVTVHPNPVVSFTTDSFAGCAAVVANFTDNTTINAPSDTNLFTWNWNFGNGTTSTNQDPQGVVFSNNSNTSTALYTVSLTVTAGALYGSCSTTDSVVNMITVYPKPIADFTFSPQQTDIYESEITFIDNSIIASQYLWDLGDGTSSIVPNPVHEYADSGSYVVTLFIENMEGCKDTTQKIVKIDPVFTIYIPNAFTPDGDNLNDYFSVKIYGIVQLQTSIYDKWGELLFESDELEPQWNGTYKNKEVQFDMYVYKVRAKDVFNVWHEYIGKIMLVK